MARKRIYLISPRNPENFWSMQHTVNAVGALTLMPNAALATLRGLTPVDVDVEYAYCDENVSEIDWSQPCDLAALTGYTLHAPRLAEISAGFRERGIPVALGGPFSTLSPDKARAIADHVFVGEAERTWPRFLRQWLSGNPQEIYREEGPVDLAECPPPDWAFVRAKDYLYFPVQAGRGCPHRCDFCTVVKLLGKKHRVKPVESVLEEVRAAHSLGADTVFFSEDNFFAGTSYTRNLVRALIEWNGKQERPLSFSAQATLRIGSDEDILRMLADARFSVIFLGIETLRGACLEEVNKGSMSSYDPVEMVRRISSFGILPFIGFIVGFDHDDEDTFDEIEGFLDETGSPIASVSILNAPEGTPLFERMRKAGRLHEDFEGVWHMSTNIQPLSMTQERLLELHGRLFRRLYEPGRFEERTLKWLSSVEYFTPKNGTAKTNWSKMAKGWRILKHFSTKENGEVRRLFFRLLRETWKINPKLVKKTITLMSQYCHYHHFANRPSSHQAGSNHR